MEYQFEEMGPKETGEFLTGSFSGDVPQSRYPPSPGRSHSDGLDSTVESPRHSLENAIVKDLNGMPPTIAQSPLAILALQLAAFIDRGEKVPECSRELRQVLAELQSNAGSAQHAGMYLDQLQAKREQRRNA